MYNYTKTWTAVNKSFTFKSFKSLKDRGRTMKLQGILYHTVFIS